MRFGKSVVLYSVPTVIQNILAIAVLPFSTRFLGPEEYGVFGVVTSVALVGGAIASLGVGYVMPAQYPLLDHERRKSLVSTAIWLGLLVIVAFSVGTIGLWLILGTSLPGIRIVTLDAIALAALAAVFSTPWTVAHQVIVLDNRARAFAAVVLGQSAIWFLALLAGLYLFDLGILALFYARTISSAVQLVGAAVLLRPLATLQIQRRWFRKLLTAGIATTSGNIMEQVQASVASLLLSAFVGVRALGLYVHSLQYRSATITLTNGFANAMWPITLSEARELKLRLKRTETGWRAVHFLIAGVGLGAVVFGEPFLAWLTNDRFTAAAPLLAIWMILVLVQTSGRKANGLLYSSGEGVFLAMWNTMSIVAGTASAISLVPSFGIAGAVVGLFVQHLCYRIGMQLRARRSHRDLPFEDTAVLVHIAVVAGVHTLSESFSLGIPQRAALVTFGLTFLAFLDRRSLFYAATYVRDALQPTPTRESAG